MPNQRISDYIALTKPGLTFVSVSTAVGSAFLGLQDATNYYLLLHVFVGAYLAGAGAGALNQYIERRSDAQMARTGLRPLPARRLPGYKALYLGVALAVIGVIYLIMLTTLTAGIIAVTTLIVYLAFYTPLKRKTPAALYLGGFAGALPPLIGWTAVNHEFNIEGLSLFLILFLWQIPHFLSLAWIHREDYKKAGYRVSSVKDPSGESAGKQIIYACILLIPASFLPTFIGLADLFYILIALPNSLILLVAGYLFYRQRKDQYARNLFIGSILYIPLLYTALVIDTLLI